MGDGPRHQAAAAERRRRPHPGDGPICAPAGRRGLGPRRHAAGPHRWLPGVDHGAADALRPLGPAPPPPPRGRPVPQRLYAQGGQTRRRRQLVRGSQRVVLGPRKAVTQVVAAYGWQLQPAWSERVNLARRQHGAAGGRRVTPLCTGEDGLRQQLALSHGSDNVGWPPAS